jgi:hypothetical protein
MDGWTLGDFFLVGWLGVQSNTGERVDYDNNNNNNNSEMMTMTRIQT